MKKNVFSYEYIFTFSLNINLIYVVKKHLLKINSLIYCNRKDIIDYVSNLINYTHR